MLAQNVSTGEHACIHCEHATLPGTNYIFTRESMMYTLVRKKIQSGTGMVEVTAKQRGHA